MSLRIIKRTYRGVKGWSISGTDNIGRATSIFCYHYDTAVQIKQALREDKPIDQLLLNEASPSAV